MHGNPSFCPTAKMWFVHRFDELPKLAADAKKYGITTFEILGWDMGGIDRGYPQYRPNPRLGTPEEFRKALADMRAMGVHPLIFSNVDVADTATPLFQDKLKQYAVDGRWAPDWTLFGWGEGTISARAGLTRSNMTLVSPAHPEFRKFLIDQYLDSFAMARTAFNWISRPARACLTSTSSFPFLPTNRSCQGFLKLLKNCSPALGPSIPISPWPVRYGSIGRSPMSMSPTCAWEALTWIDRAALHLPRMDRDHLRRNSRRLQSNE